MVLTEHASFHNQIRRLKNDVSATGSSLSEGEELNAYKEQLPQPAAGSRHRGSEQAMGAFRTGGAQGQGVSQGSSPHRRTGYDEFPQRQRIETDGDEPFRRVRASQGLEQHAGMSILASTPHGIGKTGPASKENSQQYIL